MRRTITRRVKQEARRWAMAAAFAGGLLLMGSDGPWFPWPNLAGMALFAGFAVAAVREERRDAWD